MDEILKLMEESTSSMLSVIGMHRHDETQKSNGSVSSHVLEEMRSRFEPSSMVGIKKRIKEQFIHGLPSYITFETPVLYLKKKDKSEFTFYDPIKAKWIVISASHGMSCYGSPTRDLPFCEWPLIKRKRDVQIPLDRAIQKSPILHHQITVNGFNSLEKVPVYLLVYWLFGKVSETISKKLYSTILIYASIDHLNDASVFVTDELQDALINNIAEYSRIFPLDLVKAVLNNFSEEITPDKHMDWSLYLVNLNQMRGFDGDDVFLKNNILSPLPPKLFSKKMQAILKDFYLNPPTENPSMAYSQSSPSSFIGVSVEPIQNPGTVFYAGQEKLDDSGYRLGSLNAPDVLKILGAVETKLNTEKIRRNTFEDDLKNFIKEAYSKIMEKIETETKKNLAVVDSTYLLNPQLRDAVLNAQFETRLPNIPSEKATAFRTYRKLTDLIFELFLSKKLWYADSYYESPVVPLGTIDAGLNPLKITFHDYIGRRFLIWSSEEELRKANDYLNGLKAKWETKLRAVFPQQAGPSSSSQPPETDNSDIESFLSIWPQDLLLKRFEQNDSEITRDRKKNRPGPILRQFKNIITRRLRLRDFSNFQNWFNFIVYDKYQNGTLELYGFPKTSVGDWSTRINEVAKSITGILSDTNRTRYSESYYFFMNSSTFAYNIKEVVESIIQQLTTIAETPKDKRWVSSQHGSLLNIQNYEELDAKVSKLSGTLGIDYQKEISRIFKDNLGNLISNKDLNVLRIENMFSPPLKETSIHFRKFLAFSALQRACQSLYFLHNENSPKEKGWNAPFQLEKNFFDPGFVATTKQSIALNAFNKVVVYHIVDICRSLFLFFQVSNNERIRGFFENPNKEEFYELLSSLPNYTILMKREFDKLVNNPKVFVTEFARFITFDQKTVNEYIEGVDTRYNIFDLLDVVLFPINFYRRNAVPEDDAFYKFDGPNQMLYSLIQRCFVIIFDFLFQGFLFKQKKESDTKSFLFPVYLIMFTYFNYKLQPKLPKEIILQKITDNANTVFQQWKYDIASIGTNLVDILYGNLVRRESFKSPITDRSGLESELQKILSAYLSFTSKDGVTVWPFPYIDVDQMIDLWIQQRYIFGYEENGTASTVNGKKSYSYITVQKLFELNPRLKWNLAVFFLPILSLVELLSSEEWMDIKYALWILDKDVNFKMYQAGGYIRRLRDDEYFDPNFLKEIDTEKFPIVSFGYESNSSADGTIESIAAYIQREIPEGQHRILSLDNHISKLSDHVFDLKTSDPNQYHVSKDRILYRLWDMGYQCFVKERITDFLSRKNNELLEKIKSGKPASDSINETFDVTEQISDTEYLTLDTFKDIEEKIKDAMDVFISKEIVDTRDPKDMKVFLQFVSEFINFPTPSNPDRETFLRYFVEEKKKAIEQVNEIIEGFTNKIAGISKNVKVFLDAYRDLLSYIPEDSRESTIELMQYLYSHNESCKILLSFYNVLQKENITEAKKREELFNVFNNSYEDDELSSLKEKVNTYLLELFSQVQSSSFADVDLAFIEGVFDRIGRFFIFSCSSISLYDFKEILTFWEIEFSTIPIDDSTLKYAWLRSYFREEIAKIIETSRDGPTLLVNLKTNPSLQHPIAKIIVGEVETSLQTSGTMDALANIVKSKSPITFFKKWIPEFFDKGENVDLNATEVFKNLKIFIPQITSTEHENYYDFADAMLLSRFVEIVSETFASMEAYSLEASELFIASGELTNYISSDPRLAYDPILGLKRRNEDFDSYNFPQLSPYSTAPYLNLGAHTQVTQMIVHLNSPFLSPMDDTSITTQPNPARPSSSSSIL